MHIKHFIIRGKVQGVFFRVQTKEMADTLGVNGWVRNCPDGSVEVHLEGEEEDIRALEEWLHHGPDRAEVESVTKRDAEEEGCAGFLVRG